MKLRNKETGETYCNGIPPKPFCVVIGNGMECYSSLAELNEEWEDYEEYWFVGCCGRVFKATSDEDECNEEHISGHKIIGNYFETKEEAEKALEKFKAWKRLKDKGFKIESWDNDIGDNYYKTGQIVLNLNNVKNRDWDEYDQITEIKGDLDLLFGGEE